MISAHTTARIHVASKLSEVRDTMLAVRPYVCLKETEVDKIDSIVLDIDVLVNRVMGVK